MANRVSFVTHAYRTHPEEDLSVRALYGSNVRIVELKTNSDLATAMLRASEELAAGASTRGFKITVEAIYTPDNFIGAPPQFAIYSPADNLNGEEFTAYSVEDVDLENCRSTLLVR